MTQTIQSFLMAGFAATALSASAVTIGFDPGSATVSMGGNAAYDLVVSDLASDVLAGYAIQVNLDPTVARALSVTYGAEFGNNPANQLTDLTAPGQVFLLDVANASVDLSNQSASFVLARFTLQGLSPGTTALTIDPASTLTTAAGADLPFTATPASLTVTPDAGSAGTLLGLGLLSLGFLRTHLRAR